MTTSEQTCDPKDLLVAASNYTVTGSNGSYLTVDNIGATSWSTPSTSFTNGYKNVMTIPTNGDEVIIEPSASLTVKGSIVMNGEDLETRLERIETLLHIPSRDIKMEEEFPKLKQLWKEYNSELEKYKTWKRLNNEN